MDGPGHGWPLAAQGRAGPPAPFPKTLTPPSPLSTISLKAARAAGGVRRALSLAGERTRDALHGQLVPVKRVTDRGGAQQMALQLAGSPDLKGAVRQDKRRVVGHQTLSDLVRTDPVTWGLVRMTRTLINQVPWDIVPDIDGELGELDRWYDQACDCINDWGYAVEFGSSLLPPPLVGEVSAQVKEVLKGGSDGARLKRYRLETLFRVVKRQLEQEALLHAAVVRARFLRPNEQQEKSLRALLELVVADLLIDDAGVVVKGRDAFGQLAELYTVPGYQIVPLAFGDRTVPQPPDAAYLWEVDGRVKRTFTNSDITYIMENPQGDGYGMSPVEALVQVITASLLGDNTFIKNLREGSIPPFIINLKEAGEAQRKNFEAQLWAQMQKAGGNRGLVLSGVPSEDGEFQFVSIPKGADFQKMQVAEYMRLAPGVKAFAFGYEYADLGLLADMAEGRVPVAEGGQLTERRAVLGRLNLLQEYFTSEVVKQEWPFADVKFAFEPQKARVTDPLKLEQSYSTAIANGSMSRNEARKMRGMRPMPGGDVYTITTGNALVQVDALEPADADQPDDVLDPQDDAQAQPGVVKPLVTAEPKKRNNATRRQIASGSRTED